MKLPDGLSVRPCPRWSYARTRWIELEAPDPSYLGVWLWRIGLWDMFPQYAPREPIRPLKRGNTDGRPSLERALGLRVQTLASISVLSEGNAS